MTMEHIQLYVFGVLISSFAAIGLLLIKSKTKPTWQEIIGTALLHGTVGGSLGIAAYEKGGKVFWQLCLTAASYGAGYITLKSYLNKDNRSGDDR